MASDEYRRKTKRDKKAKAHYKKIGDKVSFAYTLWGEGTAFKMMGMLPEAKKDFSDARKLFKETRDERRLSYCELSFGELEFLKGRRSGAKILFQKALKRAKSFFFGVEMKYAGRLIQALKRGKGFPFNLP